MRGAVIDRPKGALRILGENGVGMRSRRSSGKMLVEMIAFVAAVSLYARRMLL